MEGNGSIIDLRRLRHRRQYAVCIERHGFLTSRAAPVPEVKRIAKAPELGLLIQGLMTHGAGKRPSFIHNTPIDLVGHLAMLLGYQIGKGGLLGMANGVLQALEADGPQVHGVTHMLQQPPALHLTLLELPIRSEGGGLTHFDAYNHRASGGLVVLR